MNLQSAACSPMADCTLITGLQAIPDAPTAVSPIVRINEATTKADACVQELHETFRNDVYAFIYGDDGSGIQGTIPRAKAAIAPGADRMTVVSAHDFFGIRGQLIEFTNMPVAAHDTVRALNKQGKSLDELPAVLTAAFAEKWGQLAKDPSCFMSVDHGGL